MVIVRAFKKGRGKREKGKWKEEKRKRKKKKGNEKESRKKVCYYSSSSDRTDSHKWLTVSLMILISR